MIKKTTASFILVVLLILFFDIDVTQLTDNAVNYLFHKEELMEQAQQPQLSSGTITVNQKSVSIGDSLDQVLGTFGDAMDTLASEYGFTWYVFHKDYHDYIQIGMDGDRAVSVYTNSPNFDCKGVRMGMSVDDVRFIFGEPIEYIQKGMVRYTRNSVVGGQHECDWFDYDGLYINVFYDVFKNNTVTSVHIIEKDTEMKLTGNYGAASSALADSFEKQNFYAVNALRVREGLPATQWSDQMRKVALGHSRDMAENDYFDHTDLDGNNILQRAQKAGVKFSTVAENLASGGQNGIVMHELLMNSEGHRHNVLGDYRFLGVGVAFNEENRPFLTQNYYSPQKIVIG